MLRCGALAVTRNAVGLTEHLNDPMASETGKVKGPVRKRPKRDLLSRIGVVSDWGGHLFVYADRRRGEQEARQTLLSLELRGVFKEAVKGVTDFELGVVPSDKELGVGNAEIACVGVFSSAKPSLRGSVYLSSREFDLIVALAAAGKLAEISVNFQEPRYGSALIASVSFSSEPYEKA